MDEPTNLVGGVRQTLLNATQLLHNAEGTEEYGDRPRLRVPPEARPEDIARAAGVLPASGDVVDEGQCLQVQGYGLGTGR